MNLVFVFIVVHSWVFGEVYGDFQCYKVDGLDRTIVSIYFRTHVRFFPSILFVTYKQTELYRSSDKFLRVEGKKRLVKLNIKCDYKRFEFSKISKENRFERSLFFMTLSFDYAGSQIIDTFSFKTRVQNIPSVVNGLNGETYIIAKIVDSKSVNEYFLTIEASLEVTYLPHSDATDFLLVFFDRHANLHLKIKTGSEILQKKITEWATLKVSLVNETGVVVKDPAPLLRKAKILPLINNMFTGLQSNFFIAEEFKNYYVIFQLIGSNGEVLGKAVYPPKGTEFGESTVAKSDFEVHGISRLVADTKTNINDIKQAPLWFMTTISRVYHCLLHFGEKAILIDHTWNGRILLSESRLNKNPQPDEEPITQGSLTEYQRARCRAKHRKSL
ncbi:hypothetical protein RF11_14850 [Thelohanellus kitauei]|uniref:Uncharacterized protein n=1 Tax=Thelohanellus kitauei TaxID=669202 RepID=A0A0C2N9E5_THEKT|nr:hypothetical protein RF11_14850 [Thelohanellus kitauei]